jgi:hypothetical protein
LTADCMLARAALCASAFGARSPSPAPGAASFSAAPREASSSHHIALGYVLLGPRAVRADIAERVARAAAQTDLARIARWLDCPMPEAARIVAALDVGRAATARSRRRRRPRRRVPA